MITRCSSKPWKKEKTQVFLCRQKYFTTGKCQAQNVSESGEPDVTNPQFCVQDSAPGKCGLTTLSVSFVVLTVTVGNAGNVPSYDKEPADTARALFQPRDRMSSNALSQWLIQPWGRKPMPSGFLGLLPIWKRDTCRWDSITPGIFSEP